MGTDGIEPSASVLSGQRSTTELRAQIFSTGVRIQHQSEARCETLQRSTTELRTHNFKVTNVFQGNQLLREKSSVDNGGKFFAIALNIKGGQLNWVGAFTHII